MKTAELCVGLVMNLEWCVSSTFSPSKFLSICVIRIAVNWQPLATKHHKKKAVTSIKNNKTNNQKEDQFIPIL